jgi:CubicO group peptidase (beta-lactamase class C family)
MTLNFLFLLSYLFISLSNAVEESPQLSQLPKEERPPFSWKRTSDYSSLFTSQEESALKNHELQRISTNALIIIKDDTILFEKYYNGFNPDQKQRLWSISKSFASVLIGIAEHKKLLTISSPVSRFYPEMKGKFSKKVTIEQLLTMSSGLSWLEGYESNPFKSHVVNMLYLENQKDMASFVSSRPSSYRPGEFFRYSSGDTNLALGVLKRAIDDQSKYDNFPWSELFNPLGIKEATWEQDQAGTFVGSSYLYLSPRSLARFARLILNKGSWDEEQLLSPRFINKSLQVSPASCFTKPSQRNRKYTYGFYWWLNSPCPEAPETKAFKKLPDSLALALGHHGQILALFPQQNAIAIRLGADKKHPLDKEKWLNEVFSAIKKVPNLTEPKKMENQ